MNKTIKFQIKGVQTCNNKTYAFLTYLNYQSSKLEIPKIKPY